MGGWCTMLKCEFSDDCVMSRTCPGVDDCDIYKERKRKEKEDELRKNMSYKKCFHCPHSCFEYRNGLEITCRITKVSIVINDCVKKGKGRYCDEQV